MNPNDLLPPDEVRLDSTRHRSAWRPSSQRARNHLKRLRFGLAWGLLALLGGTLLYVFSWLHPQPSIHLHLVGAGYQENLSVPQNVPGWRWLHNIESFAKAENQNAAYSANTWNIPERPVRFTTETSWDSKLDSCDEPTVVLCFSLHGAADESGPYLLPGNCRPTECESLKRDQKLRVESVLERLGRFPEETKKLLILDTVLFQANWKYGILGNQFARSLRGLNEQINDIPNLVVLCGCDQDQRAWQNAGWNASVFGHFLLQGLQGAAIGFQNDGRVNAWNLYQYTKREVISWVSINRNAIQEPLLLPFGETGKQRAAEIDLGIISGAKPEVVDFQAPSSRALVELKDLWQTYNEISNRVPAPQTHSPELWRSYQQALLRFEQLVALSEYTDAAAIKVKLEAMQYQLDWERQHAMVALQGNLFIGETIGAPRENTPESLRLLDLCWNAPPSEWNSIWHEATEPIRNESLDLAQLRITTLGLLYERAMNDPAGALKKSSAISQIITDPLIPIPAEINFLQMLSKHYPGEITASADRELLRSVLTLRRLAEATASGHRQDESHCEEVLPWLKSQIKTADQQRRLGEDLMFAGPKDREKAAAYFTKAMESYQMAQKHGAIIADAVSLRNDVFEKAERFALWIVFLESNKNSQQPRDRDRVKHFEKLLDETHRLDSLLQKPDNSLLVSSVSDMAHASETDLPRLIENIQTDLSSLESGFQRWWKMNSNPDLAADAYSIEKVLSFPDGTADQRLALLQSMTVLNQQSASSAVASATDVSPDHSKVSSLAMRAGVVQGRLALARIGQPVFDADKHVNNETFEQVDHRLDVLGTDQKWWRSLQRAANQIAMRLNPTLPVSPQQETAEANEADEVDQVDEVNQQWSRLARLARSVDVSEVVVAAQPNRVRRNHLQSQLFADLADRSLTDRWYGLNDQPYYLAAANNYLQIASRSWNRNPVLSSLGNRASASAELGPAVQVVAPTRLDLTTENTFTFQVGLEQATNQASCESNSHSETLSEPGQAQDGFTVFWVEPTSSLDLIRPRIGQRIVKQVGADTAPTPENCTLVNPVTWSNGQTESSSNQRSTPAHSVSASSGPIDRKGSIDQNDSIASQGPQLIRVSGFFRGQAIQKNIPVALHTTPGLVISSPESPEEVNLAVRASQELNGAYGKGSGALAIILDASGSMGAQRGQRFNESAKYFEATRALETVLRKIPEGVSISLWAFGQATGPEKTVQEAEQTIRRIVPPTRWQPADSGQLPQIMKSIQYPNIEPWNESPIVETILAARQDLLGASGFRSVLVVTDGIDNRFENSTRNQQRATIPEALRASFDQSGITINIIGFQVADHEKSQARQQFEIVEQLTPPGQYIEAKDSQHLANALNTVLHQRIRYWLDDYANKTSQQNHQILVDASQSKGGDRWYPERLLAGSYSLWSDVSESPTQVLLDRGDRLLLQFEHDRNNHNGLQCRQLPVLKTDYAWKPTRHVNDWDVSVLENTIDQTGSLSLLMATEKQPEPWATAIQQNKPFDIWFQVSAPSDGSGRSGDERSLNGLQCRRGYQFPIPTWQLNLANWPTDRKTQAPVSPRIKVWFAARQETPAALRLQRGTDYQQLHQLTGTTVDIDGSSITFESLEVEEQKVRMSDGRFETQPALVVRISHEPNQLYRIRTAGHDFAGSTEMYYPEVGKHTAAFWPVTQDSLERLVTAIEIVSIDDVKHRAEEQGYSAEFNDLPSPSHDDLVSPPLFNTPDTVTLHTH